VIDANNSAQPRPVKLGRAFGEDVLISEGLQPNERYVLDGLFKVQPGVTVKPVAASSDASVNNSAAKAATQVKTGTG
jgi:multidrug efflux pump subunit AcrA (membrane-fusion protein)